MNRWGAAILLASVWPSVVPAEERAWEIRAELVSVKPGDPETVVLRLRNGKSVELPATIFSDASRAAISALARKPAGDGSDARAEDVGLPETLEADLRACRTAADAADTLRLVLADDELSAATRSAAEQRLEELGRRAARGEVRLGADWVAADRAAAATREAEGHYRQAVEMYRLGNQKAFEEELRRASKADPGASKADMLIGFAHLLAAKPSIEKAQRAFADAAARDPTNAAAWNNVGVCEVQARRFQQAADAFEAAAARAPDSPTVLDNVGFVIRMAANEDRRARITPRQLDAFTGIYRGLAEGRGSRQPQPQPVAGLAYLSFFGVPVQVAGGWDLGAVIAPQPWQPSQKSGHGVVVAEGHVVVPGSVIEQCDQVFVRGVGGLEVLGSVVGWTADRGLALLRCDGLQARAVPLAAAAPRQPGPIVLFSPQGDQATTLQGRLLAPADNGGGSPRFVYQASPAPRLVGLPIIDAGGRLIGLTARQPQGRAGGDARGLGVPVDLVWPLLKKHLKSLEPAGQTEPTSLEPEEFLTGAAVTVIGRSNTPPAP